MRICHISDTHGELPLLKGKFDIIVHSGDIFPTLNAAPDRDVNKEIVFQRRWVYDNSDAIRKWFCNKPVLIIPGNHDYVVPAKLLAEIGVEAHDLTDTVVNIDGIRFYGFPYIHSTGANWAYERERGEEMEKELDAMRDNIIKLVGCTSNIDALVAHAPLYGILDRMEGGQKMGNSAINNELLSIWSDLPSLYLHGHIHQGTGVSILHKMLVSNSFMRNNIIEI